MSDNWTREELRASVEAYIDMQLQLRSGKRIVKKEYYRKLSERFKRTEKAYEYRMQNISYIFSLLGRDWVPGLRPARNVGAKVAADIEAILAEVEHRAESLSVTFETQVQAKVAKGKLNKPAGIKFPRATLTQSTQYERDPDVKAWVLIVANGVCECCGRSAPFTSADGPFLEVHHVRRLADGGSDSVGNAVALCPNCHRELHYGIERRILTEKLYRHDLEG